MPSKSDTENMFNVLTHNGLDFIERSTQELQGRDQKFAVAHFAVGLELLLKARLFKEHWRLISNNPHTCTWDSLVQGHEVTVAASGLLELVQIATGTALGYKKQTQKCSELAQSFLNIFKHRNAVLHWTPPSDLESTEREQCLAMFYLHGLLVGEWQEYFLSFRDRIDRIYSEALSSYVFRQSALSASTEKIEGWRSGQILAFCPRCQCEAGKVELQTKDHNLALYKCAVCQGTNIAVQHECECGAWMGLSPREYELCGCGIEWSSKLIRRLIKPERQKLEPDCFFRCSNCQREELTVVPYLDNQICFRCGALFDDDEHFLCAHCHTPWAGTEDSYGCPDCIPVNISEPEY